MANWRKIFFKTNVWGLAEESTSSWGLGAQVNDPKIEFCGMKITYKQSVHEQGLSTFAQEVGSYEELPKFTM